MAISDEDHLQFMQTTAGALGRIEANQASQLSYLNAVNENQKKTKEALDNHKNDETAHGRKARGEVWAVIGKVLAGVVSVCALLGVVVKIVLALAK